MGDIVDADRETFGDLVADGEVLVDVWGPQCQPCLALMPHVEQLAAERESLRVVKVEAPNARRLCIDLRVLGLPTFLLFDGGNEVGRLAARDVTPAALRAWVEATLDGTRKEVS